MNRAIVLMMLVLSLLLATGCTTPPTRDPFDVTLEAHRDAIVNDTLSLVAVPSSADVPGRFNATRMPAPNAATPKAMTAPLIQFPCFMTPCSAGRMSE